MAKRLSAHTRTNLFIVVLLCLAALTGYNYFFHPFADRTIPLASTPAPSPTATPEVVLASPSAVPAPTLEQRVRAMDARQKVSLILAASVQLPTLKPEVKSFLAQYKPGVVVLFGSAISSDSARVAISEIDAAVASGSSGTVVPTSLAGSQPIIAVDHEGGTVARLSGPGFLKLPSWQVLCATNQVSRTAALAQSASELARVGVDMVFGPVLDSGAPGAALGSRICSSDPAQVASASGEYVSAFKAQGITSVVKHFPGIGSVASDLHDGFSAVSTNDAELQIFRSVLGKSPASGVMTAHVGVVNQNAEVPCSLSADCVGQLTAVFPQALVVSDGLDMPSAQYQGAGKPPRTIQETALRALMAGNDVLVFGGSMPLAQWQEVHSYLVSQSEQSASVAARLDQAAAKVLLLQ